MWRSYTIIIQVHLGINHSVIQLVIYLKLDIFWHTLSFCPPLFWSTLHWSLNVSGPTTLTLLPLGLCGHVALSWWLGGRGLWAPSTRPCLMITLPRARKQQDAWDSLSPSAAPLSTGNREAFESNADYHPVGIRVRREMKGKRDNTWHKSNRGQVSILACLISA